MTSRAHRLTVVLAALAALVAIALAGCDVGASPSGQRPPTNHLSGCGPVRPVDEVGARPSYARGPLARFPNDHAACAGVWLPGATESFVPQGIAVDGRVAWVSGFDGSRPAGERLCRLLRVDLRTGQRLGGVDRVTGSVGAGPAVTCRHGGGLAITAEGLWLAEKVRLWLLDPETLSVLRAWRLQAPVAGSFAVTDGDDLLGLGAFRSAHSGHLAWFDPEQLVAGADVVLDSRQAVRSGRVPRGAQGAVWADLGQRGPGLWFTTSNTRCGTLVGAGGTRRAFVPGAEGLALAADGDLWAVSESGTRPYQELGGRPLIPMLLRFETNGFDSWQRPDCQI